MNTNPLQKTTTVPFSIKSHYKKIMWQGEIPVFNSIPSENDYSIAIEGVEFYLNPEITFPTPRICIDLGIVIVTISKSDNSYYMVLDFSLSKNWTWVYAGFQSESWKDIMIRLKSMVEEEVGILESHLTKIKRLVWE